MIIGDGILRVQICLILEKVGMMNLLQGIVEQFCPVFRVIYFIHRLKHLPGTIGLYERKPI
jgi:hypothetical protein